MITKHHKELVNAAMSELTAALHKELINTGLVTKEQWNEGIAPKMSGVIKALEEITVTARTYRIP